MINRILLEYKKNIFWSELDELDRGKTRWQIIRRNVKFMPEYAVLGITMIILEVIAIVLYMMSKFNTYNILQLFTMLLLLVTIFISNKIRVQEFTDYQYERTYNYAQLLKDYLRREYKINKKDDYRLLLSSIHNIRTTKLDEYLAPYISGLIALGSSFLGGLYSNANDIKEISTIFFLSLTVAMMIIGISISIHGMKKTSTNKMAKLSLENALLILSVGVEKSPQSSKRNCKQRCKYQKKMKGR